MRQRELRYQEGQLIPGTNLRVVKPIGYGGMGAIYECEETFTELRYVVKVIHADLISGQGMLERMQKEAKVLAKLNHPNIIRIFWAGLTDESPPLFYYVMEKLNGYSLRRLCRKAVEQKIDLPIDSVLKIVIRLLHGLDHAHRRGIIHRDIKPDNVFVHSGIKIKLLDFGIVVEIGVQRTTSRGFVGTVAYGATELFTRGEITPATDLWSVGVLLYELLTGRLPFGDAPTEHALAVAILTTAPRPPNTLRPDIPQALNDLILELLEKDPLKRPSDAHVVAAQLSKIRAELGEDERDEQDLMAPGLMEGMGPPSITNVEEEVPPSSERGQALGDAIAEAAPDDPRRRDTEVVVGQPAPVHRGATEVLAVPPAVAEPLPNAVPPSPPNGCTPNPPSASRQSPEPLPAGRAVHDRDRSTDCPAHREPTADSRDPEGDRAVPWADVLRQMGGDPVPTIQRAPLPENLALSLRNAKTPAFGVVPVARQGAAERNTAPMGPTPHATPSRGADRTAPAGPSGGDPRTAFQPFEAGRRQRCATD